MCISKSVDVIISVLSSVCHYVLNVPSKQGARSFV
jgi:hypothetical protein